MRFFVNKRYILISSRKDDTVCVVNEENGEVIGRSENTGRLPTGLDCTNKGFMVTNFTDSTMELHTLL